MNKEELDLLGWIAERLDGYIDSIGSYELITDPPPQGPRIVISEDDGKKWDLMVKRI